MLNIEKQNKNPNPSSENIPKTIKLNATRKKDDIKPDNEKLQNANNVESESIYTDPKNYIRVKTDHFFIGHRVLANKTKVIDLIPWKTTTIKSDFGSNGHRFREIKKYVNFVNVPDNTETYQREILNCYNLYDPPKYLPVYGNFETTINFLTHLFRDKLDLVLDYLSIIYKIPSQNLPVICIVSKTQETGKTTFLKWLNEIYGNNSIILGNEDFQNKFNSHYASKLISGIDESFIEKKIIKEKLKRLTTDDKIQLEAKGKDQIKIDFIGKFILLSNNENNFMEMTDEDNRFFVVNAPPIQIKDPNILEKLKNEIPAFLYFLNTREIINPKTRRLWFDPKLYETEAMKKVIVSTRSRVEKGLITLLSGLFGYDETIQEIKITPVALSEQLEKQLKGFNGLQIEIEKTLKESWNLKPEHLQKFNYPIEDRTIEPDENGKMVANYTITWIRRTGTPYTITRDFINNREN